METFEWHTLERNIREKDGEQDQVSKGNKWGKEMWKREGKNERQRKKAQETIVGTSDFFAVANITDAWIFSASITFFERIHKVPLGPLIWSVKYL